MRRNRSGASGLALIGVALFALALAGCANFPNMGTANTPATASELPPPPAQNAGLFYDFPDVPIPSELSLVANESQVFQGGDIKSGLLVFKGRVDPGTLIGFFQAAMLKENWTLLGSVRHRKSALIFQKPDRVCLITIKEKYYSTYAEIYVVPTPMGN